MENHNRVCCLYREQGLQLRNKPPQAAGQGQAPIGPHDGERHLGDGPKGPLSMQLGAVLASRDDALVESVYGGLRSASVPLPEIYNANYEVSGYTLGAFPLECHVSFARSDPVKYDVVLLSQEGLLKPMQSAPAACPALFLFDGDDTLNPRRE